MSETKWTPGPWIFSGLSSTGIGYVNARLQTIAQAWDFPEAEANARLIAAAPDLLEALESAMRWIGSLTDWEGAGDPDVDKWREALAKAKGEQS